MKEPHATPPLVRFENVTKRFGAFVAVDGLSLDIRAGEFFALLGPSGCGKTTLLRMLAGFETPDSGRVLLEGQDLAAVPPYRRPINMMFQTYALFPHLTVEGNIAFGLKQEGLPRAEIAARVEEMLALTQLEGLEKRKPEQLSGGQRQRVALARALAKRPKVLLLDEPLAALDRKLREETRFELKALQARLGLTFVIVTHDREEAMALAGRMAVMNRGRIVQVATPAEIYEQPRSRFVADFIGDVNFIEGRLAADGAAGAIIETNVGRLRAAAAGGAAAGDTVWLAVRPERMQLSVNPPSDSGANRLQAELVEVAYLGDVSVCKARIANGTVLKATVANRGQHGERAPQVQEKVWLTWSPEAGIVLTQ